MLSYGSSNISPKNLTSVALLLTETGVLHSSKQYMDRVLNNRYWGLVEVFKRLENADDYWRVLALNVAKNLRDKWL